VEPLNERSRNTPIAIDIFTRSGDDVGTLPANRGAAVDDESAATEAERLATWWETLSNLQRREAYSLGQSTPMPEWMVTSLFDAQVPELVERPSDPPDLLPPWYAMPHAVAELVARRRRIDASV